MAGTGLKLLQHQTFPQPKHSQESMIEQEQTMSQNHFTLSFSFAGEQRRFLVILPIKSHVAFVKVQLRQEMQEESKTVSPLKEWRS